MTRYFGKIASQKFLAAVSDMLYNNNGIRYAEHKGRQKGINVDSTPRVTVNTKSETGKNLTFHDNLTGRNMNAAQFVRSIELGAYPDYYVRRINGVKTPVSKPDGNTNNNLG